MYQALPEMIQNRMLTVLLSSLHFLAAGYPSQSRYFEHLHSLPPSFMPTQHAALSWLSNLAKTLRMRNYSQLEALTDHASCERVLTSIDRSRLDRAAGKFDQRLPGSDLAFEAMCSLVGALRAKARETTWLVLRSAYRELSLPKTTDADPASTREWLYQSLALQSVKPRGRESAAGEVASLDMWIETRCAKGDMRPREGIEGRWVIAKPKT